MDFKYGAEQIAVKKSDRPEIDRRIEEITSNHERIHLSLNRLQETLARLTGPFPVDDRVKETIPVTSGIMASLMDCREHSLQLATRLELFEQELNKYI